MLLNAKPYVEAKMKELKERLSELDVTPKLAIIQVEGNQASDKYVGNKKKKCAELGIPVELYYFSKDVESYTIEEKIAELNSNDEVTGILIQLPLPKHLDEQFLINQICPYKDVDGLTWYNIGRLSQGIYAIPPCTPKGVIELMDFYDISLEGKDVLIINRSDIVGKPLAQLFLKRNATVTIAHSKTQNLKEKIKQADIVVTAVGKPNFLKYDDFKEGATVVDVSINFVNGRMYGDIKKTSYGYLQTLGNLTPVPGGVGQATVMALVENVIKIAEEEL